MASGRAHRGVGCVGVEHDDLGPAKVAEQALGRLELLRVGGCDAGEEGERLGVAQVRVGRGVRHERHLLHAWNHSAIGEETRPSETGCQQAVVRLTGDARDDHRLRGAARADRAVQRPAPVAQLLDEVGHGERAVAAGLRAQLDLELGPHEQVIPHAVAVIVDHLGRAQELRADLHVVVEQPADVDLRPARIAAVRLKGRTVSLNQGAAHGSVERRQSMTSMPAGHWAWPSAAGSCRSSERAAIWRAVVRSIADSLCCPPS